MTNDINNVTEKTIDFYNWCYKERNVRHSRLDNRLESYLSEKGWEKVKDSESRIDRWHSKRNRLYKDKKKNIFEIENSDNDLVVRLKITPVNGDKAKDVFSEDKFADFVREGY